MNTVTDDAPVRGVPAPLHRILGRLHAELTETLNDQLDQIILFGSQARGEAVPGSDVDVLIVVRDDVDYGDLIHRTSDLIGRLSLEYDILISRAFVSRNRYDHEDSPFLINVRREGVPA